MDTPDRCQNSAELLLADYVQGSLGENERLVVEAHLPNCQQCRDQLRTMLIMTKLDIDNDCTPRPEHLSAAVLAAYYEHPDALNSETLKEIERHLQSCEECQAEFRFLNDLEADIEELVKEQAGRTARAGPTSLSPLAWLGTLFRRPIFAYVLVIILAYPAYLGFRTMTKPPSTERISGAAGLPVRLVAQTRGTASPVVIHRVRSQAFLLLEVPFYPLPEERGYDIHLVNESRIFPAQDLVVDFHRPKAIRVVLRISDLPDGRYRLVVSEHDRDTAAETAHQEFPFELLTKNQ
jgi:hypothetical protein